MPRPSQPESGSRGPRPFRAGPPRSRPGGYRSAGPREPERLRYVAFNKPYGFLSQFSREPGSDWGSLADFSLPRDVYAAGRLDADSEGLLFLTNDGRFAHKLLQPQFRHPRVYWAQVEGVPTPEQLDQLRNGVDIRDYRTLPAKVWVLDPPPRVWERQPAIRFRADIPTTWLEITLVEGKNRQVRRMTAAVGLPTLRLIRSSIARLKLGQLQPGEWREVDPGEVWLFPKPGARSVQGQDTQLPEDQPQANDRKRSFGGPREPRPPRWRDDWGNRKRDAD